MEPEPDREEDEVLQPIAIPAVEGGLRLVSSASRQVTLAVES
jgi:hypothetical protein